MTTADLSTITDVDLELDIPCELTYESCAGPAELHLRCSCGCPVLACSGCWQVYAAYVTGKALETLADGRSLIVVECGLCHHRMRADLTSPVSAIEQLVPSVVPL